MTEANFFEKTIRKPLEEFRHLSQEQRAPLIRSAVPDLHFFFDQGRPLAERDAPARTRSLASSLRETLAAVLGDTPATGALGERIITDAFLRSEADRDQNVYLGRLFTRTLTRAVPDLIFQPVGLQDALLALRWAQDRRVPVTLRGAASTAMGGSVPNDGGLTIDVSRLDSIEVNAASKVCVVGSGARMRTIHQKLARQGLALKAYPSNLGGTLAGWFVTGGIGLNAFNRGVALDTVKAADVLLPSGIHLRFQSDGRLDVPDTSSDGSPRRRELDGAAGAEWFRAHGLEPLTLADLAGSEGTLGLVLQLTVEIEPRPEIGAFLLEFTSDSAACEAAAWIAGAGASRYPAPANIKQLSGPHVHHTREVWRDEDSRSWRDRLGNLSAGVDLPWTRIAGPEELGVRSGSATEPAHGASHAGDHGESHAEADGGAHVFVDFFGLDAARRFAEALSDCPGEPRVLAAESARFASDRFKPQQTKRLGPGLLAAEILMPSEEVPRFLPAARALAAGAGRELDAEVYYLAGGRALVIAAYLTDHRSGSFAVDLMLAPALLDLAGQKYRGKPYVLGRWQAPFFRDKFGSGAERLRRAKRGLDPSNLLNRGVLFGLALRGPLGALAGFGFRPGVSLTRVALAGPLSGLVRSVRGMLSGLGGPARGRGEPARVAAAFCASPPEIAAEVSLAATATTSAVPSGSQSAAARALNCVNCGECNSVCPIFHESKIRLPQMLTHLGESVYAGEALPAAGSVLLDLCMRCGNCEEVCQAGIPHLPLYEQMQAASDRVRPRDVERHTAVVASLRASSRYLRDFLDVRPGGYLKRAPASLPGVVRYVLMRAENDSGPASTCIHCGACVSVCPTGANHEYQGAVPRWITTEQSRCIGCGTCVEVCPANLANGGQTLRVMEAPAREWFVALEDLEQAGRT